MWNVTQCDACGAFKGINRECIKCNPLVPVVRTLDPKNWKEEWHAIRNAEALLLEDIERCGDLLPKEVTPDAPEGSEEG